MINFNIRISIQDNPNHSTFKIEFLYLYNQQKIYITDMQRLDGNYSKDIVDQGLIYKVLNSIRDIIDLRHERRIIENTTDFIGICLDYTISRYKIERLYIENNNNLYELIIKAENRR